MFGVSFQKLLGRALTGHGHELVALKRHDAAEERTVNHTL